MNLLRVLKPVGTLVFYLSFKLDRLRLTRLINRGLKVGRNVYLMTGIEFDYGYPFLIEIGDNCRIAKGVRILAHDATAFRDVGVTRIAPVRILPGTFIGENAMILPGVTIGPRALIAACSFVNRDVGEDTAVAGNPARPYGKYSDVMRAAAENAKVGPVFDKEKIEDGTVMREDVTLALKEHSVAFIRGMPKKDPYYVNTDIAELRTQLSERFRSAISSPSPAEKGMGRGNRHE